MADSVLTRILDATVTAIQALALTGISSANIVKAQIILDRNLTMPCIRVAPWGPEEILEDGDTANDRVVYPIAVAAIVASNQDPAAGSNAETYYKWRQRIRRRFHNQAGSGTSSAFTALAEVYDAKVKPLDIVDRAAWMQANLFVTGMVLRVFSNEDRTYSA